MLIGTPADLGAVIRDRRKRLTLDQSTLAKRIGVSRQWLIDVEHGHPRAELALVLRLSTFSASRWTPTVKAPTSRGSTSAVVDAIVTKAKPGRPHCSDGLLGSTRPLGANSEQRYRLSLLQSPLSCLLRMRRRQISVRETGPVVRSMRFAVAAVLFWGALGRPFYSLWNLPF